MNNYKKHVLVFISSTYADMHAERDHSLESESRHMPRPILAMDAPHKLDDDECRGADLRAKAHPRAPRKPRPN